METVYYTMKWRNYTCVSEKAWTMLLTVSVKRKHSFEKSKLFSSGHNVCNSWAAYFDNLSQRQSHGLNASMENAMQRKFSPLEKCTTVIGELTTFRMELNVFKIAQHSRMSREIDFKKCSLIEKRTSYWNYHVFGELLWGRPFYTR